MALMSSSPLVRHLPKCSRYHRCSFSVSCAHATNGTNHTRLDQMFSGDPVLFLERSLKTNHLDTALWQTRSFSAEVHPDLPAVSSLKDWFSGSFKGVGQDKQIVDDPWNDHDDRWFVRTCGVQTRSLNEARRHLLYQAGLSEAGGPLQGRHIPQAVLILSGSHPARRLPLVERLFSDSTTLIQEGVRLRDSGVLPNNLSLWAVENPLRNPVGRLEAKVNAGAEVVVTQPPLLWDVFEEWMNEVHRRSVTSHTRLVVGAPMISSSSNLAFWLALCDVPLSSPPSQQALESFRRAEAQGKEAAEEFCRAWNRDLINKVLGMPGVSGLHVMPLTNLARTFVLEFLEDGIFQRQEGRQDEVQPQCESVG